jgi:hypothetical protein
MPRCVLRDVRTARISQRTQVSVDGSVTMTAAKQQQHNSHDSKYLNYSARPTIIS